MLIKPNNYNTAEYDAFDALMKKLSSIGEYLTPRQLDWAIRLEEHFNKYGKLTDRQLEVLVDILSKHEDEL